MLEREVEKYFCDEIKKLGGLALKFTSPSAAGVPDRLVLLPGGRVVMAELKADTGRLSPVQLQQIKRIRRLGFQVFVTYGRAGVDSLLNYLGREEKA